MAKGIPLMGRGPDGKAKMINVDENGNVKVQQSGNMVAVVTQEFEIRDTTDHIFTPNTLGLNPAEYRHFQIYADNTLKDSENANVGLSRFRIQPANWTTAWFFDGEAWINSIHDAVPLFVAEPHLLNSAYPFLDILKGASDMRFVMRAASAPSSGRVRIMLIATK